MCNDDVEQSPVVVNIRRDAIEAALRSKRGLTFKGFGALSGNATSALLLDYKAEHPDVYWQLIETLFGGERPLMNTIKVEMGNDRNNSTGPNAATMRSETDIPRVLREPGFQLAADALRVQPHLHVSILRWNAPAWVRNENKLYLWYKNTILMCYRVFGFMVDTVNPDVNERTPDLRWVCEFAQRVRADDKGFEGLDIPTPGDTEGIYRNGWYSALERELFHRIRIITSDEETTGTFGQELIKDDQLRKFIDIAAYHYSVDDDSEHSFTTLADQYDMEIWNSEAQAVFSNSADRPNNTNEDTGTGIGGAGSPLEMANTIIKGFVASRRTCVIYQPAIGSCYEHMEYAAKELISARDPWSGWIYYDAGCAVLGHFARCAQLGWDPAQAWRAVPQASACEVAGRNPVSGARHGEPSYMTLVDPQGRDFSVIIVNDSAYEKTYHIAVDSSLLWARLQAQMLSHIHMRSQSRDQSHLQLLPQLHIWETAATRPSERYDTGWMRDKQSIQGEMDQEHACVVFSVHVQPWSMITATTLTDVQRVELPVADESARAVLDIGKDTLLYEDDFCYDDMPAVGISRNGIVQSASYRDSRGDGKGVVPRYTTDTNGAFEVMKDPFRGHVLMQQITRALEANTWIEGDPRTAIGDMRWTNYRVSIDVRFARVQGRVPYMLLGAREMGGDKYTESICAYDFKLRADGNFLLRRYGEEKVRGHGEDIRRATAQLPQEYGMEGSKFDTPFMQTFGAWDTVTLEVNGADITAFINGCKVAQWHDPHPQSAGRINIGSSFNNVRFSNLRVERIEGASPYYSALIDDMHMVSWTDMRTPVLRYEGEWQHLNGQGMFTYLRTISSTTQCGASVSHTFTGTGLDVFGPSDGSACIDVLVDGVLRAAQQPTIPNEGSLRTMLRVEGLDAGEHTVTLRLANDARFAIDAIGVLK